MNVYSMFEEAALKSPKKIAIVHNEYKLSYDDIYTKVTQFSAYLYGKGIIRGSKVAIYEKQGIDFVVVALSLAKIGAIIIPINTHITDADVSNTLAYIDVDFLIVSRSASERLDGFGIDKSKVIYDDGAEKKQTISTEANNTEPFVYITTSGSTGVPKVVEVSAVAMPRRIRAEKMLFDLTSDDVILVSMPLYHACGFRMSLTALTTGMTLVILSGFTPARWLDAVIQNKATYTIAVPTQLSKIVAWCKEHNLQNSFDSLTHLSSASAFLSEELRNEVLKIYRGNFYNMYASSETDFIALTLCNTLDDINTLGEITKEETVIIDKKVETDLVGEICCRSDWLFTRYVNDEEMTTKTRKGDFFLTGDLGRFQGDILYYGGRKKNIIISGGINIVPVDIESRILELPGIEDCIAFGVEDPVLGEAIHVAVKLSKNSDLDIRSIRKHCLKRLADFQQPRKIEFTDYIKRNSMGKIVRE